MAPDGDTGRIRTGEITALQAVLLNHLSTVSLAGIVGFEPTVPASKAGALAAWRYPSIMEIRAGLEPVIAAVKGLCPNLLDERNLYAGSCLPALGDGFVGDEYVIYAYMQQSCKSKQVIYCR